MTAVEMDDAIEAADWPKSFVSPFVMEKLRNIGLNVESLVVARMRGER